jgi:CHAT domain-containing protein
MIRKTAAVDGWIPGLAVALALLGWGVVARAPGGQPAEELSREERSRLEKEAAKLNGQMMARYRRGQLAEATQLLKKSLVVYRRLYPAKRYPDGHPHLVLALNNLGFLLQARGEYGQAETFFRDALAMRQKLYPADRFPQGHPNLAVSLNNLGALLQARGEYVQARPILHAALAMSRKLSPTARFPQGHPNLAVSLSNVGYLFQDRGENDQARPFLHAALAMRQDLVRLFAEAQAEAEALNYLATLPDTRGAFLSVTAHLTSTPPGDYYPVLWAGKAALARVLERRQRLLHGVTDPALRKRVADLLDLRSQLARLLLAPAPDKGAEQRAAHLQELTERKEKLEKGLARRLSQLAEKQPLYTDLVQALPRRAAFIDLLLYGHREKGPKARFKLHYVAFILRKGHPVRRVELGAAAPIEIALAEWRQNIEAERDSKDRRPSPAACKLRQLVWDPLARHLPDKLEAVYLCPDDPLSALPWAALPGRRPGTVLLEDHAIALVPHGPFLLEQLTRPAPTTGRAGVLLALGGVRYDGDADRADRGGPAVRWRPLRATAKERRQVADLARRLHRPPKVIECGGGAASIDRLLADLPKARWAHLATHGFFAAPRSDIRQQLYVERDFLRGVGAERRGAAARNPLTQSGLVLAGANRPQQGTASDNGILTGEAIAGLDLSGLELAVLSACETGLGEAQSGEGVFGLQRAFHLAGTRNVVASLWQVDDQATCAPMALFYRFLWEQGQEPLQALRSAQLALYRHPRDIPALARTRGQDFTKTVKRVSRPTTNRKGSPTGRSPVKHWAAFVLSGAGR